MQIRTIEPTPSPNTMKVILTESLSEGKANNYHKETIHNAPQFIQEIFAIEGVTGVYHVADFLAVERHPKADWKVILPKVRAVFGEENRTDEHAEETIDEHFGEIQVQVQVFKDIPMQVKVTDGTEEVRKGLREAFTLAVNQAALPDDNIVMMRKWSEQRPRYGDLQEVAEEVAAELEASYSDERLERLAQRAHTAESEKTAQEDRWIQVTPEMLDAEDWRERFSLLERLNPTLEDLPVLEKALEDEKASIRRLAVVYFGMIEDEQILPYLEKAMKDKSVTVRRTAGDAFSDIGSEKGIPAMIDALSDKNKLVRWRAAMFLYELGDDSAVKELEKTAEDPEFEVALQAKLALARIQEGEEAKGSVWKQMTEAFDKK
ncbi:conserved virulence factor C family protein [Salisediminibacterium halotolerans]|uniref:conserved virulence factor C family protein n=1 Tax=Salisediminibacterium halotolerans TaxID=517425 RepID=UPI000EAF63D9|nr:conserved virulence factor C family protein [Salisediminibacterium halotolerans]RLJ77894.1 HEAT repeat protein [Actinophytocola xinjiangensis]RPE88768.1 HEAT repeat protein [Salisediminibacterium halotolerans]TWG36871.1 HEAT repeat protein [Salisediminibacterium halotolerans]GEL08397.1 hypothetical protein SHA02_18130 [Salisediminibacterium halotolerans]